MDDIIRVKYPRTHHLYWSESNTSDDVWLKDTSMFEGKEVIVTEKLDGENTTIYPDGYVHARSLDTDYHPSRSWVKKFAATFAHQIPSGLRICGENLYAFHSILYTHLPTYFFVFGIYDSDNNCLSWDETEEICVCLGLHTVPVLYRGIWDENKIKHGWTGKGTYPTYGSDVVLLMGDQREFPKDFFACDAEGYVVRLKDKFQYDEFSQTTAKFVRKNHVQSDQHWLKRKVFPNILTEDVSNLKIDPS